MSDQLTKQCLVYMRGQVVLKQWYKECFVKRKDEEVFENKNCCFWLAQKCFQPELSDFQANVGVFHFSKNQSIAVLIKPKKKPNIVDILIESTQFLYYYCLTF